MSVATRIQHMGLAALIMSLSILLSRFMGLLRDKVISWQYGASGEADLYFAAFVVPDFINYLLAGGYVSITLMPLLSRCFDEDEDKAWRFFSAVFWWALLAVSTLTIIAMLWAAPLAKLVAPGFSPEQSQRLTLFLRIILPAQIFFVSGACFSALLFLRKQFFVPALTPLIYNGAIIICGLAVPALGIADGMVGFCIGVTLGAGIGAFALPYWATTRKQDTPAAHTEANCIHSTGLRLYPLQKENLRHPLLRSFLFMALPLMLGQSVVMLNEQFMRIFGSMLSEGSVSLLSYARRMSQVPVGMIGQAIAVASYPFLATLAAKKEYTTFNETLRTAMTTSTAVLIPISAWMIAAAVPCMGFIFEGGDFGQKETLASAPLLQIMMLMVPLWGVQMVLGRAFYALGDTLTPAVCGTVITIVSLPLFYYALRWEAIGIALVSFWGVVAYIAIIMYIWNKKQGLQAFKGLGTILLFGLFLSFISGIVSWYTSESILRCTAHLPSIWPYMLALGGSLCTFTLCYAALTWKVCPQLIEPLIGYLRKFIKK